MRYWRFNSTTEPRQILHELPFGHQQQFRPLRERVQNSHNLRSIAHAGRGADHDNPVAVFKLGQHGIGIAKSDQGGPGKLGVARAQTRVLCHPQQLPDGDWFVSDRVVVEQPLQRKVYAVVARHQRKARQDRYADVCSVALCERSDTTIPIS